ncbi:nucleolar complex protein 3 homolog isoform X2 [Coccinella septempunctata]|uniref:nucleolar complex protein 3 homolog isoform X2 n=1 Tax=Coccinella septempunctata TaxID=41139 RepID=UPI001D06C340|nr:nucleolar complex protein 3 homolog isoform X2 [Coccinella septempunctata]
MSNIECRRSSKKRKRNDDEEEEIALEKQYEEHQIAPPPIKFRNLLPIKTKQGLVPQQIVQEDEESEKEDDEEEQVVEENETDEENDCDITLESLAEDETDPSKPLSAAELFYQRNKALTQRKLEIGVLSSQVLENPEEKVTNLRLLLKIMDEQTPVIYITVRKLVIISLLEIFKDIIPAYRIRTHKDEGILLKKSTLKLRKFETELLQHYKKFLQKLEKACMALQKKKGNTATLSKEGKALGHLALSAMCDLLVTHPYFNFSENITQVIVPFLNHKDATLRKMVKEKVETIFKEDKKEELTLKILRVLNHYLKSHAHNVKVEMLEVTLVLRLRDVNLEKEKELEVKQKKLMSKKQNVLQISKKERKRKKQLQHLEKELLETKAEENKQAKQRNLTEITKIVFAVYFRILKSSTNNKAVGVCLEGLAKFAHCINLDYYMDMVNLLDKLLKEEWIGFKEQLHCIQTVFAILSGQGESLTLDPTRFYNNIYKNLLEISASSKAHEHFLIVLQILSDCLIKRRKKITNKRMIGFVKRIAILSLHLLHNGSLGALGLVRNIMQLNKNVDILLDTDNSFGDGNYMPELDDAEYSNAASTSLYELALLNKHYHPIVKKFVKNIVSGVPTSGEGSLVPEIGKLRPEELFQSYDMSEMAFNPSVPVPKKEKITPSESHQYKAVLISIFLHFNGTFCLKMNLW